MSRRWVSEKHRRIRGRPARGRMYPSFDFNFPTLGHFARRRIWPTQIFRVAGMLSTITQKDTERPHLTQHLVSRLLFQSWSQQTSYHQDTLKQMDPDGNSQPRQIQRALWNQLADDSLKVRKYVQMVANFWYSNCRRGFTGFFPRTTRSLLKN